MNDGEARIINGVCDGNSLRVAIDSQQSPLLAKLREDKTRMATATKSTINVDTIRTNIQAVDGVVQQYRFMFKSFHHFIRTNPATVPKARLKRFAQRRYLP